MGGHPLEKSTLTAKGIPGDRAWTLKDEEHGGIKGGKRFPQLLDMSARFIDEPSDQGVSPEVQVTLHDGRSILSSDRQVNVLLSAEVVTPVRLSPLLPADHLEHDLRPPMDV